MSSVTTFIIADNQAISCAGLYFYVNRNFPYLTSKNVRNKQALISALNECGGYAVVIIDYAKFDFHSIDEMLVVQKRFYHSHWIVFSLELSEISIRRLSIEPSISLLLKECEQEEITTAFQCAVAGIRYICHQITNLLLSVPVETKQSVLTVTEIEILKLIAMGKTVKEIATVRNSSIHTIITHKKNIFRKIEVNNVYEATKYALRSGLVEMMEYYI